MSIGKRISYLIVVVVIMSIIGLLIVLGTIPAEAMIGFLGVLVGGAITGVVQYVLAENGRKQQLRLAALDKRLATTQEAHALWFELYELLVHTKQEDLDKNYPVIKKCKKWLQNNSLYLTHEARKAFRDAYLLSDQITIRRYNELSGQRATSDTLEDIRQIKRCGVIIEESVFLPSLDLIDTEK